MKQTINESVLSIEINAEDSVFIEIDLVESFIKKAKSMGANRCEISTQEDPWGYFETVSIEAFLTRIETDEEYKVRIEKEREELQRKRDKQKEIEIREYERLKRKFKT